MNDIERLTAICEKLEPLAKELGLVELEPIVVKGLQGDVVYFFPRLPAE